MPTRAESNRMNPFQFLKQLAGLPAAGKDGIRVGHSLNLPGDLKTTAGLTLTAATVPTVANNETNAIAIVAAASGTANGSFVWAVPKTYDESADELKIKLLIHSGGDTDTPTMTATAYRKRAGAALTSALTVVASAAINNNTTGAGEVTIDLSGNSLRGGDVLTINLVAGAHTTDTTVLNGVRLEYKSGIVFQTLSDR